MSRRKTRVPEHRKKLLKNEAPEAVRDALKVLGLYGESVRKDKSRIDVYTHRNGTLLGHFEWVPRNGYQLFIATPVLRTRSDTGIALDDLKGLEQAHAEVQAAWDKYAKTHSSQTWDEYLGALAAFYMRSFAPALKSVTPATTQQRLRLAG